MSTNIAPELCPHRTVIRHDDGHTWADCGPCWDAGENLHPGDHLAQSTYDSRSAQILRSGLVGQQVVWSPEDGWMS